MPLGRAFALVVLLFLSACSIRTAIDMIATPEDRAYAERMVASLRNGDHAWLEQQFDPDLWKQSAGQLEEAARLYPDVPGTTEMIGFHIWTNTANGVTERTREATMVTHGNGRWTVTAYRTQARDGPDRVTEWRVTPHDNAPPELVMLETMDRMVPWIWAGLLLVLLTAVGIIFLILRSNRRRRESLENMRGG